jgi:predicted GNAT superfamily acetyltransferase
MAGSQAVIGIRPLSQLDEFAEVVRLQEAIWGFDPTDLLPMRFLVVLTKVGGHVFGAYDGSRMIGFCFAMPGIKPGPEPYLHSHMLGVLPDYRDGGVGRRLKLRQREDALARGISRMEWTFDPLEVKNAFFNIERLGAVVRRYVPDQYGITASPLHGGLPTDRCYAEWWLDSPRVTSRLGQALSPATAAAPARERISYPADIAAIRVADPACAREIQRVNGGKFQDAFARGLAVTGFERGVAESSYLLEPWR